jgi:hypothetical protein
MSKKVEWKIYVNDYRVDYCVMWWDRPIKLTGRYKFVTYGDSKEPVIYVEVVERFLFFFTKKLWYSDEQVHAYKVVTEEFTCGG